MAGMSKTVMGGFEEPIKMIIMVKFMFMNIFITARP